MPVSIQKYPVSLVLKNILTDRFSGELVLSGPELKKSLYFQDGDLVFSVSDVFDERLGVILYLLGKLDEEQYDYIQKLKYSNDLDIGKILVQNHFINDDDLFVTTLFQMKKVAINAFKIGRGEWEMISGEPGFDLNPEQRIQLPPIIAEGARKIEDISFFIGKIQFLSPRTSRIPEPLKALLNSDEIDLFRRLQDCRSLPNQEIISKLNLDPHQYWKNLILFILLDLIDFTRPRFDFDREDNIRQLLEFHTRLIHDNPDSYQILGVSPSFPKSKAKMAFLRLSRQFHPDHYGSAAAPEIKKIAAAVFRRINDAYSDLKYRYKIKRREEKAGQKEGEDLDFNAEVKENYEIELDQSGEAMVPEPEGLPDLNLFEEEEPVEPEIPGPDEQPEPQEQPPEQAAESEPSIISMKEEMSDMGRAGTLPTEDLPVVDGQKGERKAVRTVPETKSDGEILEEAEELYMEKKYHDAARILKTALKKRPEKGEYHYLLGLCQTHMEFFQEEAERHLKRAIELNPWNSDPVYALGILFRIQGKTSQAASCFERVMKISKDHSKAVKAMRELSIKKRKKSALFSFFKKENREK